MTRLRIFLLRLWALVRSRQTDREIDDEISRWAARRSVGGATPTNEMYRQVRAFMWLEGFARGLRPAVRTLPKKPAFTTGPAATLAPPVCTHTPMFHVLDAGLARRLPRAAP